MSLCIYCVCILGPNKSLQADVYRSLRLPIVLVGDARLGGISSTVSAFESLRIRGYTVHAVVLIGTEDPNCSGNAAMLEEHFQSLFRHVPGDNESAGHAAWSLGRAPKVFRLSPMPADQQALLHGWYRSNEGTFASVLQHVSTSIADEWKIYLEMSAAAGNYIWWPFTQHANLDVRKDTQFIESAHGDNYRLFSMEASEGDSEGRPLLTNAFDASASWWTQAVGHGNSHMSIAIGEAAGRYGHIIFPRNLHAPVAQLSRYLIEKGPGLGWAERVFYSDNGSTAMEIALKMAFRLHELRHTTANAKAAAEVIPGEKKRLVVVSQRHGYHGDTLGTMNTSSPSAFNKMQHPWYACSALVLDIPTFYYRRGHLEIDCSMLDPALFGPGSIGAEAIPLFHTLDEVLDTTERMASPLAQVYRTHIVQQLDGCQDEIGALVLEPMMLGAGGLTFLDPLFQKVLISECKARNVPVVFDEVAVGMYRLGPVSTSRYLQESPDIACYGKMLSGGYIPLAVTLASHEVFSSFLGDTNSQALMHGHSYTANPIACTAALEAIRLLEHCPRRDPVTGLMANMFGVEDLISVSKLPGVASVMGLGSVLSIQLCARGGNSSPPAPGCSTIVGSPVAGKVPPEEKCLTKDDEEDEEDSVFAGMSATQYNALYASFVVSVLRQERLFARPLGNTIYIMTTPFTTDYDRQRLLRVLRRTLTKTYYMRPTSFSPASTDDEDHKDGQESGDVYFEKNTTIV